MVRKRGAIRRYFPHAAHDVSEVIRLPAERQPKVSDLTESQIRQSLARQLMENWSPLIGQEIAITGSVARGVADQDSDLELNFWSQKLPSKKERESWLKRAGATDVTLDLERLADGSVWSTFRVHGIWVEAGWQTNRALERNLRRVLVDKTTDHDLMMVA